jgi:hypothetical protein
MDMLWRYKLEVGVMELQQITSYPSTDLCELYDAYKRESRSLVEQSSANG